LTVLILDVSTVIGYCKILKKTVLTRVVKIA